MATRQVRIKYGSTVMQDFNCFVWENNSTVFTAETDPQHQGRSNLRAYGYGLLGLENGYGNGAIWANDQDLVDVKDEEPRLTTNPRDICSEDLERELRTCIDMLDASAAHPAYTKQLLQEAEALLRKTRLALKSMNEKVAVLMMHQSVCYCGVESRLHNPMYDGHSHVPMEEPCPYAEELQRIRKENAELKAYADKLAQGLPEGMLPKDIEILRESNARMASALQTYRNAIDNIYNDCSEARQSVLKHLGTLHPQHHA